MAWARRGRRKYYYRSVRLPDGRVGRKYYGGGVRGERAAKEDTEARARREADRLEACRAEAALEPLNALAAEMDDGLRLLATATFLAGGLHQHNRQWRKRRRSLEVVL